MKKEKKEKEENPKEEKEEKPKEEKGINSKTKRKLLAFIIFGITAGFLVWTNNIRTIDNASMLLILIFSFMVNVIIISISLVTNTGVDIIKRYINKFKYKTGNYVNTIFHYKTGVQKELFILKDKETGAFKLNNHNYTTNPRLLFNYKGIPTYHHREGTPDPLNIWNESLASEMSNAEIDTVMLAGAQFDFKQWLEENKKIIMMAVFIMVGAAIGAAYFGYQDFVMLRDGTYKAVEVICKNVPQIQGI